jgi:hypothetical protein
LIFLEKKLVRSVVCSDDAEEKGIFDVGRTVRMFCSTDVGGTDKKSLMG